MKRHRRTKKLTSAPRLVIYEVIFSAMLLTVLSMLSAIILSGMQNPTANIKLFSLISLLLCALVSGFSTSRYNGNVTSSILVSLIFTALMLAVSLISAKGAVGGGVFMNYLCYMLVAVFSAFLGKRRERRHRR